MKQAHSTKVILLKSPTQQLAEVAEAVLFLLHTRHSLTIEELVNHLPDFRWGDVLKAVSKLWGESVLELDDQQGQLRIRFVGSIEPSGYLYP